jgi:Zn-dependent protease with chaperone function
MTGAAIDRIHFLDEQRRNRRRSLRFSVFAVVAVGLAGIPLCVLASPLLFGLVLIGAHVVDLIAPLSDAQWDRLHDVAFVLPTLWARIRGRPVDLPWSTLTMLYLAPGALFMLLTWPFIQLLSRTAGAGMMLRRLASRDPNRAVLPEQQLANVVQEMAIAAGVRPPAVRIIKSPAVNAVAIGLTTNDAVLLATTGFLDRLGRQR